MNCSFRQVSHGVVDEMVLIVSGRLPDFTTTTCCYIAVLIEFRHCCHIGRMSYMCLLNVPV